MRVGVLDGVRARYKGRQAQQTEGHPTIRPQNIMKNTFATLLAVAAVAGSAAAFPSRPLVVDTPTNVQECERIKVTWTGGIPTYNFTVLWNGRPFEEFYPIENHSYSWLEILEKGSTIQFLVTDKEGHQAQSAPIVVQPGSEDCF